MAEAAPADAATEATMARPRALPSWDEVFSIPGPASSLRAREAGTRVGTSEFGGSSLAGPWSYALPWTASCVTGWQVETRLFRTFVSSHRHTSKPLVTHS